MIAAAVGVIAEGGAVLIAFAKSTLGRRVLIALAVLAAVLLARTHWIEVGVDRERAADAARLNEAKPAIAKVEAGGKAITAATDSQVAARTAEIRTVTRILKEEVPVYVTIEADRRCDVSAGFVSLHDQAAAGVPQVPRPAGVVLDSSSGVPLSAVADTVVDNYGTAFEWREAALACRAWAREQADLWHKTIRTPPTSP